MKTYIKKTLGFFHLTRPVFAVGRYSSDITGDIDCAIDVDIISKDELNYFLNKGYDILNIRMYGDK